MANDFYKTQGGFNIYDSEIKDINESLFNILDPYRDDFVDTIYGFLRNQYEVQNFDYTEEELLDVANGAFDNIIDNVYMGGTPSPFVGRNYVDPNPYGTHKEIAGQFNPGINDMVPDTVFTSDPYNIRYLEPKGITAGGRRLAMPGSTYGYEQNYLIGDEKSVNDYEFTYGLNQDQLLNTFMHETFLHQDVLHLGESSDELFDIASSDLVNFMSPEDKDSLMNLLHKNRTKKWAVDIGPNTAPISYDDPEYFTRRGDMLSRIKYFFDEEGNYNLEEYDWEGNLIPQESY